MQRKFRLNKTTDFERVRRFGKSYAHPLIVLIVLQSEAETNRAAVAAGRSLGNAVHRNRAKRLLREALRPLLPQLSPGWDLLLLARKPLAAASLPEIQSALSGLLSKARLLEPSHDK